MKKKLPLLFFWFPCYFSNAGRSNYSTTSKFYLFCLLNFTNNYVFRPLNLLLNCRLHPHCFSSWNLKKGQWDRPHLIRWFPCVRHSVAQGQLFLALCYLCSYYCLLPLWWTPWLRRLWPAGSCAWAMTVAVCSTSRIGPSKLPRFMSIDIHWCARQQVLIIGSWGWRAEIWTTWQAGLVLLGLHLMFGTSDHATWCFWDIPFICCKNKIRNRDIPGLAADIPGDD